MTDQLPADIYIPEIFPLSRFQRKDLESASKSSVNWKCGNQTHEMLWSWGLVEQLGPAEDFGPSLCRITEQGIAALWIDDIFKKYAWHRRINVLRKKVNFIEVFHELKDWDNTYVG